MANTSTPAGLEPRRLKGGAPYSGTGRRYIALAADSAQLMIGDAIVKTGTADAEGTPVITLGAAGAAISGVVIGFEDPASLLVGYGAASTLRQVIVCDDPDVLFEVQEDAVGGALAAVDVGLNADIIFTAGSTTTRRSGHQLDTSTKATTATLQLRVVEVQKRPDNEFASAGVANTKVLVFINNHTERNGAGL